MKYLKKLYRATQKISNTYFGFRVPATCLRIKEEYMIHVVSICHIFCRIMLLLIQHKNIEK